MTIYTHHTAYDTHAATPTADRVDGDVAILQLADIPQPHTRSAPLPSALVFDESLQHLGRVAPVPERTPHGR